MEKTLLFNPQRHILRRNPIDEALQLFHAHGKHARITPTHLKKILKHAGLVDRAILNAGMYHQRRHAEKLKEIALRLKHKVGRKHLLKGGGLGWLLGKAAKALGLHLVDKAIGRIPLVGDYIKPSDIITAATINNPLINPTGFAMQVGTMTGKAILGKQIGKVSNYLGEQVVNKLQPAATTTATKDPFVQQPSQPVKRNAFGKRIS